jgi:N-acetylmuramoyl-L-alanine amidase CwlA
MRVLFAAILLCLAGFGCQSYYNGVPVQKALVERTAYNLKYKYGGPLTDVRYITIHNTWNSAPAQRERDYLNNRSDGIHISYHFVVDELGIIQTMPLDECAWHAGDKRQGQGNRNSIGVEIARSRCYGIEDHLYRQAEENAVHLAAWLLNRYKLSVNDLRMHKDWSGKNCPHRILEEKRWDEFKARVAASLHNLQD